MPKIEIACFNLESALIAQDNGADRIELCDGIEFGGITPNVPMVAAALQQLRIDFYVMIRPRGGNFCYSQTELTEMKASIELFKQMGVKGFVFGILTTENELNIDLNKALINIAQPYPCTLHRAFDNTPDIFKTLNDAIQCGFKTILCSGGTSNASDGRYNLQTLVKLADNKITIMPGGGLRSGNLKEIINITQANFYHSSAITESGTYCANAQEVQDLKMLVS